MTEKELFFIVLKDLSFIIRSIYQTNSIINLLRILSDNNNPLFS